MGSAAMADATRSGWSFPLLNGYLGPRPIATLIEGVSGHHLTELQIAQWAIDNGEVTRLAGDGGTTEVSYGFSPLQAVATINELGRQYGMEAELRFASVADLESERHHGRVVTIEIGDAQSGAPTRVAALCSLDPAGTTVLLGNPGESEPTGETVALSALELAWSASNGAMIVTSRAAQPGPALLPVVIEPDLVAAF